MFGVWVLILWSAVGIYDFMMRDKRPADLFEYISMGPVFWVVKIIKLIMVIEKKV